jgi:glycosyltransferase involved in cell wall biosynthesis
MSRNNTLLVIDCQVLQTPALQRGMGQYLLSLLNALRDEAGDKFEIILLFNSLLDEVKSPLALRCTEGFAVARLPLQSLDQTKKTKSAQEQNKEVLDAWLDKLDFERKVFLIGSLFQAEIYPSYPDKCTKMAIMYDLAPLQLFGKYSTRMRWQDYLTRFSLVYATDKLICISKTTADDVAVYLGIQHERLCTINGGPGELALLDKGKESHYGKFILMPTGNDIRKNNRLAVEAYKEYRDRYGGDYSLVITSEFSDEEKDRLAAVTEGVIFTGVVSEAVLRSLYEECSALLFPSLHEGLGMPIIEAVFFGKPVVASSIDVFMEISESAPYYFNPHDRDSVVEALHEALSTKLSSQKKSEYARINREYTWQNSATQLLEIAEFDCQESSMTLESIAVVGPNISGISAIGKFIFELHPTMSSEFRVDYFCESSTSDKVLRPNVLEYASSYHSIFDLTDVRLKTYKTVVYHIGNSNHHTLTLARALTVPSIVVLHDLNLQNIYRDLVERNIIDKNRFDLEKSLDEMLNTDTSFLVSLVNRQKAVIVHSLYAKERVEEILFNKDVEVIFIDLAVTSPVYMIPHKPRPFTIGLAGILAGIKGLELIEKIAKDPRFSVDRIMVFGINFAEPDLFKRISSLSNVDLATNLTDYEFQNRLKQVDVLINYRTKYQGEASYATLESMRYGIPVIVRGDFGWYSELPDGSVAKAVSEGEVIEEIIRLKESASYYRDVSDKASSVASRMHTAKLYVQGLRKAIGGTK